jgi:hypothetical protein
MREALFVIVFVVVGLGLWAVIGFGGRSRRR